MSVRSDEECANEKEANLECSDGMLMLKLLITDDFSWGDIESCDMRCVD